MWRFGRQPSEGLRRKYLTMVPVRLKKFFSLYQLISTSCYRNLGSARMWDLFPKVGMQASRMVFDRPEQRIFFSFFKVFIFFHGNQSRVNRRGIVVEYWTTETEKRPHCGVGKERCQRHQTSDRWADYRRGIEIVPLHSGQSRDSQEKRTLEPSIQRPAMCSTGWITTVRVEVWASLKAEHYKPDW